MQHMIALYRSGRQGQALSAYRRLRAEMVERLGVEPSGQVRQVHHAILSGQGVAEDPNVVFNV
jgi:DNA-binding SARP family transcriptional activator